MRGCRPPRGHLRGQLAATSTGSLNSFNVRNMMKLLQGTSVWGAADTGLPDVHSGMNSPESGSISQRRRCLGPTPSTKRTGHLGTGTPRWGGAAQGELLSTPPSGFSCPRKQISQQFKFYKYAELMFVRSSNFQASTALFFKGVKHLRFK